MPPFTPTELSAAPARRDADFPQPDLAMPGTAIATPDLVPMPATTLAPAMLHGL